MPKNQITMNTKAILASSAVVLGLIGLTLTFLPKEILLYINADPNLELRLIIQLTGAFYFAFAMLNWMSKGVMIGGIYNRPVAIANLTHFLIGGLALLKALAANSNIHPGLYVLALIYVIYGVIFALILNRHPVDKKA